MVFLGHLIILLRNGCVCIALSRLLLELQCSGIDAVPEIGRRRTVIKEVTKVSVALAAEYLSSPHAKAVISFGSYGFVRNRGPEAWPPSTGVKDRKSTRLNSSHHSIS